MDHHHESALDPETDLLHQFRHAARSVTQLYRASQTLSRASYHRGYEQALQDIIDYIGMHPRTIDPRTSGAEIPAEDLVGWIRHRWYDAQRNLDKSTSPAPPTTWFGSDSAMTEFNPFLPALSNAPAFPTKANVAKKTAMAPSSNVLEADGGKRKLNTALSFMGRDVANLDAMDIEHHTKKSRSSR